jgi:hypothetical protein
LGFLFFVDLTVRLPWARTFYLDSGVLPSEWARRFSGPLNWQLALAFDRIELVYITLGLGAVASLLLLFRYQSRWVVAALLLSLFSLRDRNPVLAIGAESLVCPLLLLVLLTRERQPSSRLVGAVFLAQLGLIYGLAGYHKLNESWWGQGHALELIFSGGFHKNTWAWAALEPFAGPFASRAIVAGELLTPLLALVTRPFLRFHRLFLGMIFVFHLLIAAFLPLGIFPWASMAIWLMLWPNHLRSQPQAERSRHRRYLLLTLPVVYFAMSVAGQWWLANRSDHDALVPQPVRLLAKGAHMLKLLHPWQFYSDVNRGQMRITAMAGDRLLLDTKTSLMPPSVPEMTWARWERYVLALSQPRFKYQTPAFLHYLCVQENLEPGTRLTYQIQYLPLERFPSARTPKEPIIVAEIACFSSVPPGR